MKTYGANMIKAFVSIGMAIGFGISTSALAASRSSSATTLNFFYDTNLRPMIGLSCSSDDECKRVCNNTQACQKPVETCLSCIGTRSKYLNDFFAKVKAGTTSSCTDQGQLSSLAESLFKNIKLIPVSMISAYNPLSTNDADLLAKVSSLCPSGTNKVTPIAFTDSVTHVINEIPAVVCDSAIFPIVRQEENCGTKVNQVLGFLQSEQQRRLVLGQDYQNAILAGAALPLKFEVVQLSDYVEAKYLGCNEPSSALCKSICNSSMSCSVPLKNDITGVAIVSFNNDIYQSCGNEPFSPEALVDYVGAKDGFAFTSQSLNQTFDNPKSNGGFNDYSAINNILSSFSGAFQATDGIQNSSFYFSDRYKQAVDLKMRAFCQDSTDTYVMGHGTQIERVFCKSGQNGYFNILAKQGENCIERIGQLSRSSRGSAK